MLIQKFEVKLEVFCLLAQRKVLVLRLPLSRRAELIGLAGWATATVSSRHYSQNVKMSHSATSPLLSSKIKAHDVLIVHGGSHADSRQKLITETFLAAVFQGAVYIQPTSRKDSGSNGKLGACKPNDQLVRSVTCECEAAPSLANEASDVG